MYNRAALPTWEGRFPMENTENLWYNKENTKRRPLVKKILFVCLGNICRSPMAEFILKDLAAKAGKSADFFIASAAVSR